MSMFMRTYTPFEQLQGVVVRAQTPLLTDGMPVPTESVLLDW